MSKKAMDYVDGRELAEDEMWRKEAGEPDAPHRSGHKDTRRWCKGKEGREHTLAIEIPPNAWKRGCAWVDHVILGTEGSKPWWNCQHVELCTACGKQFRHSHAWMVDSTGLRPEECPEFKPYEEAVR